MQKIMQLSNREQAKIVALKDIDFAANKLEHCLIDFDDGWRIDIGSVYYRHRCHNARGHNRPCSVVLASFDAKRGDAVKQLVRYLKEQFELKLLTIKSVGNNLGFFMRFISWCDRNDYGKALWSPVEAEKALLAYKAFQWDRFQRNHIGSVSYR
ncbi:hypothetical protein, partial [Flavobacterium sp. B17]